MMRLRPKIGPQVGMPLTGTPLVMVWMISVGFPPCSQTSLMRVGTNLALEMVSVAGNAGGAEGRAPGGDE